LHTLGTLGTLPACVIMGGRGGFWDSGTLGLWDADDGHGIMDMGLDGDGMEMRRNNPRFITISIQSTRIYPPFTLDTLHPSIAGSPFLPTHLLSLIKSIVYPIHPFQTHPSPPHLPTSHRHSSNSIHVCIPIMCRSHVSDCSSSSSSSLTFPRTAQNASTHAS
jgi:hypothetical protein